MVSAYFGVDDLQTKPITHMRRDTKSHPTPDNIRAAREAAGLSQSAAADLVSAKRRTWQDWEAGLARMHPGLWELFCAKTANNQS